MKLFGGTGGKHFRRRGETEVKPEPEESTTAELEPDGTEKPEMTEAQTRSNDAVSGDTQVYTPVSETKAEEGRTPQEQAEIEEIIRQYQKKKKIRRGIILGVIVLLLAVGFIIYKSTVKPPEIARPTPSAPVSTAAPTSKPDTEATPAPGGTGESTPAPTEEPELTRERRENVYSILLLGRDYGFGNTDTIMVMQYDDEAGEINILSIPRDTCANVNSNEALNETKKISGIYSRAGVEGVMEAVGDMIGAPLDGYILVSVRGFIQLVDTVGGLDFDVPYYMNYDDPQQDLHIHINKGYQHLDGYNAMGMVRWRQNNDGTNYGDIIRIQNQQAFLTAMAKKCLSISNLATNLGEYIKIFESNVETDLTNGNLIWFAQQFLSLGMEHVNFYTMPSNANDMIRGFAYGTILVDEWLEMLNAHFNVYNLPLTEEDIDVIARDANGELYATSGEIKGGMDSFLWMSDYEKRLAAWLESQKKTGESGREEAPPADTGTSAEGGEPVTESAETPAEQEPEQEQGGEEPQPEPAEETAPEPAPAQEAGETEEAA